jgi:protein dithiol oxidoreductase (disulfide-forming)
MRKTLGFALFALLALQAFAGPAPQGAPVEGEHYVVVEGQGSLYKGGKVDVREFFLYACPHCYDFQPVFSRWLNSQGNQVQLTLSPLVLAPSWLPFYGRSEDQARMFYALTQMGVNNLQDPIFEAIHELGMTLRNKDEIAEFVASKGVDKQKFLRAYDSETTTRLVKEARELRGKYSITYTPSVLVDGRYMTTYKMAGNDSAQLVNIVAALVQKVKAESRQQVSTK